MTPSDLPDISPMHELEVWCASTGRWVGGFWFDRLSTDGRLLLRRGLDQQVLPESFDATEVRSVSRHVTPAPGWSR